MNWLGLASDLDQAAKACAGFIDAPEPPSREQRKQFENYLIIFNQAAVAARTINQLEKEQPVTS
jgi:hypothetical protein